MTQNIILLYNSMSQYSDLRNSVFNGYVQAFIKAPLSTNNTPCAMACHTYGTLNGLHPNPPTFYPASNDSTTSSSRLQYLKTSSPLNTPYITSKNKYIAPMPSSMRTAQNRSNAIGKSGYKVGLPLSYPLSYKAYSNNDVMIHTKFVRSGGCTAPKKKGSIYNYSLRNGNVCCLGEIPRQTY